MNSRIKYITQYIIDWLLLPVKCIVCQEAIEVFLEGKITHIRINKNIDA
jgi:hypothetical protein